MILDATAGNRTMWRCKHSKNIIYIDIEKRLEVKPTIFCDNTRTPFRDKVFDTIFYDPPHFYNDKGSYYVYPDAESFQKKWKGYGRIPRYYGGDKYKTKAQLMRHIIEAGREFYRILKDDGLLWLKWNESHIPLATILHLLEDWNELLRIYVKAPTQTAGKHQTYWVCLEKKKQKTMQTTLA